MRILANFLFTEKIFGDFKLLQKQTAICQQVDPGLAAFIIDPGQSLLQLFLLRWKTGSLFNPVRDGPFVVIGSIENGLEDDLLNGQ